MSVPKLSPYNIHSTPYKTVSNQDIPLHIFIPKILTSEKSPLIIHFHGGFLITGEALFPDWITSWTLSYALQSSAIRISVDYRLLPESNGLDILEDASDAFSRIENHLEDYLRSIGSSITPDLDKIITLGESAGGYLAIQSALLMRTGLVKAVIAAYAMTYIDDDWYSKASTTKSLLGAPQVPEAVLDAFIEKLEKGKFLTAATPPARSDLCLAAVQNGRMTGLIGTDDKLFPVKNVEKMSENVNSPFLFAYHGKNDSVILVEHSERFVGLWKEKFGNEKAIGKFEEGDHIFDGDVATLETPWLKEGLEAVTKAWLG